MTAKRETTIGKTRIKKLKLKKETIRDLKVQKVDKDIKGGMARERMGTGSCNLSCEPVGCR